MSFSTGRSNSANRRKPKLVNLTFYNDQLTNKHTYQRFTIVGRMGVPEDDPRSREPIYCLNFNQGVERLAQNGVLKHTNDQEGIDYYETYYGKLHLNDWLNKWYPNQQNNYY